jgi:hypothetical protein
LGGITFGIFGTENIPDFIVNGVGVEGIGIISSGDLGVAIEVVISIGSGSQSILGLLLDVPNCVVAGGEYSPNCIGGFGVPTEVVGLELSGVGSGASLDVGGGAGDLVA